MWAYTNFGFKPLLMNPILLLLRTNSSDKTNIKYLGNIIEKFVVMIEGTLQREYYTLRILFLTTLLSFFHVRKIDISAIKKII